jgi:hypothetical protein
MTSKSEPEPQPGVGQQEQVIYALSVILALDYKARGYTEAVPAERRRELMSRVYACFIHDVSSSFEAMWRYLTEGFSEAEYHRRAIEAVEKVMDGTEFVAQEAVAFHYRVTRQLLYRLYPEPLEQEKVALLAGALTSGLQCGPSHPAFETRVTKAVDLLIANLKTFTTDRSS